MTLTAVDCQGFAGGFTLGVVNAGFELQAKLEMKGAFGMANCLANRDLLGHKWEPQISDGDGDDWDPPHVDFVFGNPPCSGFSLLSRKDFRGADSAINHCMWRFAEVVVKARPTIAVFESVQQAYKIGLDLMRNLRAKVEWETGDRYDLYHVLHNNASVGGASIRRRYFWVISRVPFGVERHQLIRVPRLDDVIGDLQGLGRSWEQQPYVRPPSWWAKDMRSDTGLVDGHIWRETPYLKRALDLLPGAGPWQIKETISDVARRHWQLHGTLPDSWKHNEEKLVSTDFMMGYNQLIRWNGSKMARVITGGGCDLVMHPHEDRTLTMREVARIMGFPDDWRIRPLRGSSGLQLTWGKGIAVNCGEWISTWVRESLVGNPGSYVGDPGEQDREYVINVTEDFRSATSER